MFFELKKKVWLWNHYATDMYENQGGRHYWLAENLIKSDFNVTIFCANTYHNKLKYIDTGTKKYKINIKNNIPFVFVKTANYNGNGIQRIKNMIMFYMNLFSISQEYAKIYGKPDIILASSVHPLTLVAGIKIAKKFGIQCICEVRDLWPESLVAYGALKNNSIIAKLLYQGEKWIYKKADKLIFTMEGGKDYIKEKKWDKENGGPVDINKIHHINNGVDLQVFNYNKEKYAFKDEDLENKFTFKVIYTGSIRLVNNVKSIINVASKVNNHSDNIKFLIYGEGNDRKNLENYCLDNNINNVIFKGYVEKRKIPYILSKSDLNIIHFEQNKLKKYGASLNKMFDYFASGKPIISDCEFGYDLITRYKCGMVIDNAKDIELANAIIQFSNMKKDEYNEYCKNAYRAAKDFDFTVLTQKLETLL